MKGVMERLSGLPEYLSLCVVFPMKSFMKYFLFLLIFPTSYALALPWSTEMHHIEPLMSEAQEAVHDTGDPTCQASEISPFRYISPLPKEEPWRKYYKVPTLLTEKLYKMKDVCEEAKRQNEQQGVKKKYALIAHKTHLCDGGHRACLSTFKSISDPCNNFVQDNFQVFHTRTFVGQYRTSGSKQIMEEYGSMGPSLLVIDLETCNLVPTEAAGKAMKEGMSQQVAARDSYFHTPPALENAKDDQGVHKFKSDNDQVRFTAMREAIVTNMPTLKPLTEGKNDCYENGQRTLPGIKDLEMVKYGEIEVKGAHAIRKLMDEQYIEQTGINPYTQMSK
jgi:hypothetical protein